MRQADRSVIFDCAVALATVVVEQCDAFVEMCDYIEERQSIAKRIASYEANADGAFKNLGYYILDNRLMGDVDVTSLYEIVDAIEEITDQFEELANSLVRYNIAETGESLPACANALYGAGQMAHDLILSLKDEAPASLVIRNINSLDKYKSKYCKFYDEAILELFTDEVPAVDIIRSKAIYDAVKTVFEAFEKLSEQSYKYILTQN